MHEYHWHSLKHAAKIINQIYVHNYTVWIVFPMHVAVTWHEGSYVNQWGIRVFAEQLVRINNKNMKTQHHCPFVREMHRWPVDPPSKGPDPLTKGQL